MFFQRLLRRTRKPRPQVRRLRLERLLSRELLAAEFGAIGGTVVNDLQGDGFDAGDPVMAGVPIALFADSNGNGIFDPPGSATPDSNIQNDVTSAAGTYLFEGLAEGRYFVVQSPTTSATQIAGALVATVDIDAALANGINDTGQVLVDEFNGPVQQISSPVGPATTGQSTILDAGVLGGERDVFLTRTAAGTVEVAVNALSAPDTFLFTGGVGGTGTVEIQWDGPDGDAATYDETGLGSVDFTAGGATGFLVEVLGTIAGSTFDLTFSSGVGNSSTYRINVPNQLEEFTFNFGATPESTTGTGADFGNITALRGFLTTINGGTDVLVNVVGAIAPGLVTQNFTNAIPLTLGNLVFNDANNNGIFDAGETGINGVTVNLFNDTNGNGSFDSGTDTQVASTVTAGGGLYQFTGLFPGDYIVQIPQNQFALGNALANFTTSLPGVAPPDPNDNVDNDDNGGALALQGVVSGAITLVSLGEPTNDGDADNNTNLTLDFGFAPQVDVSIVKSVLSTSPVAGQDSTYRLTVANSATSQTATNVVVTDTLPAGVTLASVTVNGVDATATTTVTGDVGTGLILTLPASTLTAGQTQVIDVTVSVPANGSGAFNNVATVTSDGVDTDPTNNDSNVDLNPARIANLLLEKTASETSVVVGESYTYTLTVTNNGPSTATGVSVVDTLPTGISFNTGTINRGGVTTATGITNIGGTVTAAVGDLAVGESVIVTLSVTAGAAAAGASVNTATASANEPEPNPDPDPNTATFTVDVNAIIDLVLDKQSPATAIAGSQLTYTIVVDNNGPAAATGVSIVDTLPVGVTFDSGTGGTFDSSVAGQVTIAVPDIPAAGTTTITLVVNVPAGVAGTTLTNAAVVTANEVELPGTQGNENDSVQTPVVASIDLEVTKAGQTASVVPGNEFVYTITVDNLGVSNATGVILTDTLPAGVSLLSIFENGNNITNSANTNGQQVSLALGTFTPTDAVRTFTYTVDVASSVATDLNNTVVVTSNENANETNSINNSAVVVTTVTPNATLVITKSDNVDPATPGGTLTYTITVRNDGPSDARNVVVADTLPAGVTVQTSSAPGGAGTVNGNSLTLQFGTVAAGETQTATITVEIPGTSRGTLTNTATVSGTGVTGGTLTDDETTALSPLYDVTISQTVSPATAAIGEQVQFQIIVSNAATSISTATGVVVTNTLPAGLTFNSATLNGANLGSLAGIAIPDLTPGGTATILVNATINATATNGQQLNNTANITTAPNETNVLTNQSAAAVTVDLANRSIAGRVVIDSNYSGAIEQVELDAPGGGIAGATVTLNNGTTTQTTTTAADGSYTFANLLPGTYSVSISLPAQNGAGQNVNLIQVVADPELAGAVGGTGPAAAITNIQLVGATTAAGENNFAAQFPYSKWLFFA